MTTKALFDAFDKIEATSGKLDKLSMLQALKAGPLNDLAQQYFSISMDWYRIFGIGEKALSKYEGSSTFAACIDCPYESTWEGFLKLATDLETHPGGVNEEMKKNIETFLRGFDTQSRKWIAAALLKKTRMGVSEKTVNKVWPKLINYFEVQLADVLDNPDMLFQDSVPKPFLPTKRFMAAFNALPDHYFLEPKLDGIRAVCRVEPKKGTVQFFSRGGQVLNNTAPAGINDFLLETCTEDVVFDGELFGENWNDTTKVTSKGESEAEPELVKRLRFFIFDVLTVDEWDEQSCARDYATRRDAIPFKCMSESADKVVKTISHTVTSPQQIDELFKKYLHEKFEGVMVKHPRGLYEFKRSTGWLKYKPLMTDEFEVVGKYEGKTKSKNEGRLGGLVLKIKDDLTCQVGSGFSDEQREEFWTNAPIGKIVEVEFKERTPDGLLREPVFVRIRDDKKVSDLD